MKSLLSLSCLAALALLFLAGCSRHYQITLANQRVITTHGKPKVDKKAGVVRFTDAEGKKHVVPTFSIKSIEPQ